MASIAIFTGGDSMRYRREDGCLAWLTYGLLPSETLTSLLERYGSGEAVYDKFIETDGSSLIDSGIGSEAVSALRAQADPGKMHEMMLMMQKLNVGIMRYDDNVYPDSLRSIPNPPALLFYRGNPDCLMGKCVTVVGSRIASPRGLEATRKICSELSRAGVTIVSGLAVGIDAASHAGCLEGGSPSVAVLACGMDVDYPLDNSDLKEQIVKRGGLLLSEYPFGMRANRFIFAVRNRIMAGLSKATVMMEARIRSGSMLTVQHALEQGRDVFAYPGIPNSEWSEGSHQLLREGAIYFTNAQDLLEDLDWNVTGRESPPQEKATALPPMNEDQRKIFSLLSQDEMSFDEISAASGLSTPVISSSLTILEMLGLIKSMPGKTYCRA